MCSPSMITTALANNGPPFPSMSFGTLENFQILFCFLHVYLLTVAVYSLTSSMSSKGAVNQMSG